MQQRKRCCAYGAAALRTLLDVIRATLSALLLAMASALLPFFGRSSSSLSSFESGSGLFCLLGACTKYSMVKLSMLEPEVVDQCILA